MKKILVIQDELPLYRSFLWRGVATQVELFLIERGADRLILPDGTTRPCNEVGGFAPFDTVVVNAGLRNAITNLRVALSIRHKQLIGWTQYLGKSRGSLIRWIKALYLDAFFSRIYFYYDYEKEFLPYDSIKAKVVGLNNTVSDQPFLEVQRSSEDFLFLGRNTPKADLPLLISAALAVNGHINLHVVGVHADEFPSVAPSARLRFYGDIYDTNEIAQIAARCAYFVYAGDVGLSIVHAIKLGLVPIVHGEVTQHMPEARAACRCAAVLFFVKGDKESLVNTLDFAARTSVRYDGVVEQQARDAFSEQKMVSNFLSALV